MIGIGTDGVGVHPAAFAFFGTRRYDDDLHVAVIFTGCGIDRSFALDEFRFTDDEQGSQLILPGAEEVVVFPIGIDGNGSIEGVTDLVFLTSPFKDTGQVAAIGQEVVPTSVEVGIQVFFVRFRPIRKEDTFFLAVDAGMFCHTSSAVKDRTGATILTSVSKMMYIAV